MIASLSHLFYFFCNELKPEEIDTKPLANLNIYMMNGKREREGEKNCSHSLNI